MDRGQWIVAAGVLVVAGLAGWWFGGSPVPPPPVRISEGTGASSLTVHVSGAVEAPGLVSVPPGSRVADAVAGAGGLLAAADASALNLAAPLLDGQQVVVPIRGATSTVDAAGKVRLNHATADELEAVSGVGPVLAARIVAHRQANGPFATVEDLLEVPGIGESKLAGLRQDVVVP